MIGSKEGTSDEHWVMYGNIGSLYYIPENNIILYANNTEIKMIKNPLFPYLYIFTITFSFQFT